MGAGVIMIAVYELRTDLEVKLSRLIIVLDDYNADQLSQDLDGDWDTSFTRQQPDGSHHINIRLDSEWAYLEGWRKGSCTLVIKARDSCDYVLELANGCKLICKDNYVPHGVVPGEFGDYIILEIVDGYVVNMPSDFDLSEFDTVEGDIAKLFRN